MRCFETVETTYQISDPETGELVSRVGQMAIAVPRSRTSCEGYAFGLLEPVELANAGAGASPFNLGLDEAQQLALPILGCWAAAWAIRQVVRLIRDTGSDEPEREN